MCTETRLELTIKNRGTKTILKGEQTNVLLNWRMFNACILDRHLSIYRLSHSSLKVVLMAIFSKIVEFSRSHRKPTTEELEEFLTDTSGALILKALFNFSPVAK